MDKSSFTEAEIKTIKTEEYPELATQKYRLWNKNTFVLPEHFMSVGDMYSFILAVLVENYSELFI